MRPVADVSANARNDEKDDGGGDVDGRGDAFTTERYDGDENDGGAGLYG